MRRLALAAALVVAVAGVGVARAFQPDDPLSPRQWYLAADRAFRTWPQRPALHPVLVAVVDSGIDLGHPEFRGRIAAARSFVGGTAQDTDGHGTVVAGEIAAALDNGRGIAGIAFPARLLIAKVVARNGTIEPASEARAIRWAVSRGARVINLSIGGLRDPEDAAVDTFSPVERAAVEDAVRAGALVVASVGNGDLAPREPWPFASYPAALPHVLGVAAYGRDGTVPSFSNGDSRFVDLAAPGTDIFSTVPRSLSNGRCADPGYSDCGPLELRRGGGTSFAAPQVTAAAALLFAALPTLRAEQAAAVLERSAVDIDVPGRDSRTGWGRLDIAAAFDALAGPLPPADVLEPNDAVGAEAASLDPVSVEVDATLDYWDDPIDVYRVRLAAGQTLSAHVTGPPGVAVTLWQPEGRLTLPARKLVYRAPSAGWYDVKVFLRWAGSARYQLRAEPS